LTMVFPRHIPDEHGLLESVAIHFELLKGRIRQLYEGETLGGVRFRYALLVLDIVTVLFIIVTSFLPRSKAIESLDVVFCFGTCRFLRAVDYQPTTAAGFHPSFDVDGHSSDNFISCAARRRSWWFPAYSSNIAAAARLSNGGAASN
jgi:hypothetical protein